jgi:sterol desaturase/sphingolipid hydroxylase (fatty acid hydroxylase superfamily)
MVLMMQQIQDLLAYGFWDYLSNAVIYMAIVIPLFSIFWVFYKDKLKHRRIQETQRNTPTIIRSEIRNSALTVFIFAVIDVLLYWAQLNGFTQLYDDINAHSWAYLIFSIVLMILLHDAWFYWTHRLMHHPKLYKYVHKVHHQSVDPSPFAAFSFHPLEAVVEAGVYVLFSFLFPVHLSAMLVWQLIQMVMNVIGHLGYEIYPKGFNSHWLFRWKTPSTHHNMHHSKFNGNYGLYFTWWDRFFKTEFKDYNETFEKVQDRIEKGTKIVSIVLLFSLFSMNLKAQTVEFKSSIGFGKPYIIESIEEKNELSLGFAPIFSLGIKYMPKTSKYWGILLDIQHFEARVKGITKISQTPIDGFIGNTSYVLLAEKVKPIKKNPRWQFVSAYGLGLTNEIYVEKAEKQPRKNTYASLTVRFGFDYALNEKMSLSIANSILITDFVKGIHYLSGNWTGQSGGEDISDNLSIGLIFKL